MIPIQFNDSRHLFVKPLDSSLPSKPATTDIDFLDLVSSNNPSASTLSINDDYSSVRAEEEASKSLTEFDTLVFRLSKRVRKQKKIAKQHQDQTLVEIISKRTFTKPVKENSVTSNSSKEVITKKRRLNNKETEIEKTNIIIELEKEPSSELYSVVQKTIDAPSQPQLVLKDGKVQLDTPKPVLERKSQLPLEIVKSNKKKLTTSSSFKKNIHTEKWTAKETKKFYRALEIFGTDFAMITKLFQNRNRNQIKNKFLREEKTAPEKVDAIFKKAKTVNFGKLLSQFQKKSVNSNRNTISKANLVSQAQQEIAIRKRSGSFQSFTSLDSVDAAIMEDLAEVFVPFRSNKGLPSNIIETSS